jgi:hypothetical protein
MIAHPGFCNSPAHRGKSRRSTGSGRVSPIFSTVEPSSRNTKLAWPLPSAEVLGPQNEPTTTILQLGVAEAGGRDRIGGGGRNASGPVGPTPGENT